MGMVIETIVLNGQGYEVCFNTPALYRMELVAGESAMAINQRMGLGRGGARELVHVLFGGLEGGRIYRKQLRGPWTLDEVMALIDEAGGVEAVLDPEQPLVLAMQRAFRAAFPVTQRLVDKYTEQQKALAANAPRPTTPTDGSTGTSSSTPPAATASTKKRSGRSRSVN